LLGCVTIDFASNGVCIEGYGNSDIMALMYRPMEYKYRMELRCCFGVQNGDKDTPTSWLE